MKSNKLKVNLRPANSFDDNIIMSSWLRGAYHLCPAFRDMPRSLFFAMHHPVCSMLMLTSDVLCAVDFEDETHVLGYLVYKNYCNFSVIHWVYTKQQFRNFGIAEELLKAANLHDIVFTSHETTESQKFFNNKMVRTFHAPHFRHGEWHEAQIGVFLSSRQVG